MTKSVNIRIKKIQEVSYKYKLLDKKEIESFNSNLLFVEVGEKFDYDIENDLFIVNLEVAYKYRQAENENIDLLSIESNFTFEIDDLKEIIGQTDGNSFQLPDVLLYSMFGVSLSAVRGMMAVKTAGNYLSDYPLPLFDPKELLEKARINKEKQPSNIVPKNMRKSPVKRRTKKE